MAAHPDGRDTNRGTGTEATGGLTTTATDAPFPDRHPRRTRNLGAMIASSKSVKTRARRFRVLLVKADSANLLRFLKNADQLVVPLYQRRYSWTEEEWGQLWTDILRVTDDAGGTDHFIGSLVQIGDIQLAGNRHNPLQVIDGQQRLTTVSLLLLALSRIAERRHAAHSGDLDAQSIVDERIQEWYLVDERERGEKRYKLLPNEADRATYVALIDNKPLPDRGARSVSRPTGISRPRSRSPGARLPPSCRRSRDCWWSRSPSSVAAMTPSSSSSR